MDDVNLTDLLSLSGITAVDATNFEEHGSIVEPQEAQESGCVYEIKTLQ